MTIPLFGEFLAAASEQIDAAVSFPGELPGRARPAAIRQLGRLISALARYATDITLPDEFDPAGPPPSAHERAAANARLALLRAAEHAQLAAHGAASARADAGHPVVRHLSGAADHLAAGRDLLQTHLTPAGAGAGSSPWAPVITSPPVTTALIAELARYAHRLAPWMSQLALARTPDSAVPAPACLALHTASGWLWAAGPAMATAALPHPAATTSRRLLGAVPASTPPPRHRIGGTDTVAGLCAGAASTAERLRHAMPVAASQLRWSPTATSLSWRRDALAAAILGHTSELLLRSLASRAGHRETDSAITAGLRARQRLSLLRGHPGVPHHPAAHPPALGPDLNSPSCICTVVILTSPSPGHPRDLGQCLVLITPSHRISDTLRRWRYTAWPARTAPPAAAAGRRPPRRRTPPRRCALPAPAARAARRPARTSPLARVCRVASVASHRAGLLPGQPAAGPATSRCAAAWNQPTRRSPSCAPRTSSSATISRPSTDNSAQRQPEPEGARR